jgi:hypothetical protein
MHPINFEGSNVNLTKPENMTDEECASLPAEKNVDAQGFHYILTAWMPNKEDLESLQKGNPLFLKILGVAHPPVAMFTVNENGEANV